MKTAVRLLTWDSGKYKVEIEMTLTREVKDDISYTDGWSVKPGKKIVDFFEGYFKVNGKIKARTVGYPEILTSEYYKTMIAKGIYAKFGDMYLVKDKYDLIMSAIEDAKKELNKDAEYDKIKSEEIAK